MLGCQSKGHSVHLDKCCYSEKAIIWRVLSLITWRVKTAGLNLTARRVRLCLVQEHVDPSLDPSTVPDPVLAVMADVALICLAEEPSQRPTMKDVVGFLEPAASYRGKGGAPSQPAQQSCLRSPREDVWGSKGVFDNPFVANPFQAGIPAAPPVQRPLSSGPLGKPAITFLIPACLLQCQRKMHLPPYHWECFGN